MGTSARARTVVAVLVFLVFTVGISAAENIGGKCKAFTLGRNPVDPKCSEHAFDLLEAGQCLGILVRDTGPMELCGGNSKCSNGCLGQGEEIALDPNADGCEQLLFATACCNPPREKFCLPSGSYMLTKCKPELPPAEFTEPEPQESLRPDWPDWWEDLPNNPAPGEPTINDPAPEKKCGKGCKAAIAILVPAALYGICEWKDIGPCGDNDDHDRHKECKFGKGVDGHCLPEPPECPPCHGGVDCPPGCPNSSEGEDIRARSISFAPTINIERRAVGFWIAIPVGRRSISDGTAP